MTNKSFAIICDSTCGLPSELMARLEVVVIPLAVTARGRCWLDGENDGDAARDVRASGHDVIVEKPDASRILAVYQRLIDEGFKQIAVVCSSLEVTGIWAQAEQAVAELDEPDVRIRTVDTGVASVASAMVLERLAMAREAGLGFEEAVDRARALTHEVRFLYIPGPSAPFVQRASRRRKRGLVARASSLRLRIAGERSLYLLRGGEFTALARSNDMTDLCGRAAHAMSSVAAGSGKLVYAVMEGSSARATRALEKPLDTNEFCSLFLGHASAAPSVMACIGTEAVGVAFAPMEAYLHAGASDPLFDPSIKQSAE